MEDARGGMVPERRSAKVGGVNGSRLHGPDTDGGRLARLPRPSGADRARVRRQTARRRRSPRGVFDGLSLIHI